MIDWKNIFKKRIDPKEIPVLEDIVNASKSQSDMVEDYPHLFSSDNKATNKDDDGVIINLNDEITSDDNNEDENNVVILSSVLSQTDVDIDVAEIDNLDIDSDTSVSDENDSEADASDTTTTEVDTAETSVTEIDNVEDDSKTGIINETAEENITEVNKTETDDNYNETSDNHLDLNNPEQLEIVINKVVEQLKPELEQQLHAFVQKALAEKSPEDFFHSLKLDHTLTSDKN